MNINLWGPSLWELIHTISFNYSLDKKKEYKLFFEIIKYLIPCEKCKNHYIIYLKYKPIERFLDNKNNLILWVNKLHNDINKKLNKKIYNLKNSKKKYYDPNNILIIDNKKIFVFISYLILNNNDFIKLNFFLKLILKIYPDKIIKNKLIKYNIKNNIDTIKNDKLKKWYNSLKINKILNEVPNNLKNTGSWIKSAKNFYIKDNYLFSYLRKKDGKYIFSSIKFSIKEKYENINGNFILQT
jgi:hypothetical protein